MSCDVRREFDIAAAVTLGSGHTLTTIHHSPDPFRMDGKTRTTRQKERITKLFDALEEEEPEMGFEKVFLFYDTESGSTLPQVAASWSVAAQEVSRNHW